MRGVENHTHVIMLARKKAAVKSGRRGSVDILINKIRPQGIFLSLNLTMPRKLSKADFKNRFKYLKGQLSTRYIVDLWDRPPRNQ